MSADSLEAKGSKLDPRWHEAIKCSEEKNNLRAFSLYKALAEEGEHYALVEVAGMYERGAVEGAPNFEDAAKWYRKAVFAVDDPKAHLGLARMLFNRQLQGSDDAEAFSRHATAAAERGEPLGWLLLGLAYAGGRLGVTDKERAVFYYERAASEGMVLAERRLVRLALDSHRYLAAMKLFLASLFRSVRIAIRNPTDPRLAGISPMEGTFAMERNDGDAKIN